MDRSKVPESVGDWAVRDNTGRETIGRGFDELVLGGPNCWLHMEQLDDDIWWLAVYRSDGRRTVMHVTLGEDGRAERAFAEEE